MPPNPVTKRRGHKLACISTRPDSQSTLLFYCCPFCRKMTREKKLKLYAVKSIFSRLNLDKFYKSSKELTTIFLLTDITGHLRVSVFRLFKTSLFLLSSPGKISLLLVGVCKVHHPELCPHITEELTAIFLLMHITYNLHGSIFRFWKTFSLSLASPCKTSLLLVCVCKVQQIHNHICSKQYYSSYAWLDPAFQLLKTSLFLLPSRVSQPAAA